MSVTTWKACAFAISASGMFSCAAVAAADPVPSPGVPVALAAGSVSRFSDGIETRAGRIVLRASALTDSIIRVRVGRDGSLGEDASWAVLPAMRAGHVGVTPLPNGFATASVRVIVDPATLKLDVTDLSGRRITADAEQPITFDGHAFTLRRTLPPGEHIYGLGDKTGGTLDRRSRSFVDWNTDTGFDSSTDPIYKSIPFFISVGGPGGSYGILLDNSWRSFFDFAHASTDTLTMGSADGPIDYYVIAGPGIRDVVRRYTDLTGKAPMPPEWALGYQQSRYSYMSAGEVRQIAATLRNDRIPADVIWLDIDYQDRNRPFTINSETFPDMKGLVRTLGNEGIKLVTITDLHVALCAEPGLPPLRHRDCRQSFRS